MFKAVSRVLIIAMMLVAFVGQAVAFNTSISCETSVDSLSPTFSELVKHYDLSTVDTDSPKDCCGIECCGVNCTCIANACSSSVYFNTVVDPTKTAALSEIIYMQDSEQPKSISTLLYRPPIFTS
jgi:hypothetical protein